MDICVFSALLIIFIQAVMSQAPQSASGSVSAGGGGGGAAAAMMMPQISKLEAQCAETGMRVQVTFDRPYNGIIYSKGAFYENGCTYLQPNAGKTQLIVDIPMNACGTQAGTDTTGASPVKYFENTLVFQNDANFQEVWDVARRVRCIWNMRFEEMVKFTPFQVGMLQSTSVTFSGDDVTTAMAVQQGEGPFAPLLRDQLVQIGDKLTLVIFAQTQDKTMDIGVRDCYASDAQGRNQLQLTDENGCVLKEKLMQSWQTTRDTRDTGAAVIAYAFVNAFKFPDDMEVNIKCNIALCKNGCNQCGGQQTPPPPVIPPRVQPPVQKTQIISTQEEENIFTYPPSPSPPPFSPVTFPFRPSSSTTAATSQPPETTESYPQSSIATLPPITFPAQTFRDEQVQTVSTSSPSPSPSPSPPVSVFTFPPFRRQGPTTTPPPPGQPRKLGFHRRRRDVFDDIRQEQAKLGLRLYVATPDELNTANGSNGGSAAAAAQAAAAPVIGTAPNTLCINTIMFAFGLLILFTMLLISTLTATVFYMRSRQIFGTSAHPSPWMPTFACSPATKC